MRKAHAVVILVSFLTGVLVLGSIGTTSAASEQKGRLNINSASPDQLSKVPGISKELANEIVKYRDKNGFFKKPEDLLKVPKMTKDILKKISPKAGPKGELFVPIKGKSGEQEDEEEPSLKPSKC